MEFGAFVKEITKDRTAAVAGKPRAKKETYKISCVCTGVSFSESCMAAGPFQESCMSLGPFGGSCLATGKN